MKAAADAHLARKIPTSRETFRLYCNGALNLDPNNVMPNTRYPRIFYNKFDATSGCACVLRDMRSDGRVAVYEACSPDALQCTVLEAPPPLQVGQCGNQIGSRSGIWHCGSTRPSAGGATLTILWGRFFRQQPGEGQALKARAVLVDMEEGVVGELLKGRLRGVFDHSALITDVSGSGNTGLSGTANTASGTGRPCLSPFGDAPSSATACSASSLLHSMGGGTGSGLGTAISSCCGTQYPKFVTAVYPSEDDDVITSPYNSVLAMRCLTDYADCKDAKPFDAMNRHSGQPAAEPHGFRPFSGTLNVDLNEISMNWCRFPRLHYLLAAPESPCPPAPAAQAAGSGIQRVVSARRLSCSRPSRDRHLYLACALLLRGRIDLSDVRRCVDRLGNRLAFADWNPDCWKIGHCAVPRLGSSSRCLSLANNTAIGASLHLLGET
uniref:Tubulin domain-containing protein n=1 Tax=Macrostomum lignano TaxID=282301 RepID=A0A1I8FPI7_9PLAT